MGFINNYKPLFTVKVYHEFYSSGLCDEIEIKPTNDCRQKLQDLGLIFKKTTAGFTILYNGDEDGVNKIPIDELANFLFMLEIKNTHFTNFTELPFKYNKDKRYYFTNFSGSDENSTTLHSDLNSVTENDLIEIKPEKFSTQLESNNLTATVEVKNKFDKTLPAAKHAVTSGKFNYLAKLSTLTPAVIKINVDGSEQSNFYSSNELLGKKIFGIIEIVWKPGFAAETEYQIKFKKRSTYWRYNIFIKYRSEIDTDKLSVDFPKSTADGLGITADAGLIKNKNGDEKIIFDKGGEENDNGTTKIPFEFFSVLPSNENPFTGIRLVKMKNGNGNGEADYGDPIIANLSNPSIKNIKIEKDDSSNEIIYSEVNIYI